MNFILCNNNAGLDQTGSFTTATKCLKVGGGATRGDCGGPRGGGAVRLPGRPWGGFWMAGEGVPGALHGQVGDTEGVWWTKVW